MTLQIDHAQTVTDELLRRLASTATTPERKQLMHAVQANGIHAVAVQPQAKVRMQHTFSHEVKTGDITNQRKSGRCWMFAGLNVLRNHVASACHLDTFELSQTYQMFWDKFEKANYFLENILETAEEETSSRVVAWLLASPVQDGGQWDMFVNLVSKYGVVPKAIMPETYHSSNSVEMNRLLTAKLRAGAAHLRNLHRNGQRTDDLQAEKHRWLADIYQMLCHFLGQPPTTFDFEYRDKDDKFHRHESLTPQTFQAQYAAVDLTGYVSVIHAPTADKPFDKTYTVKFLGNVKGGRDVLYLNVQMEELRRLAVAQLSDGEPVWFGCDVGKMIDRDGGILDTGLYDYEATFGIPFGMSKAERLDYGDSQMTHAMVFTGVNLTHGQPDRWKVENSWGIDSGNKGFYVMSDNWFSEYMYQVVVKKEYLPARLQAALAPAPTELAPWDPMGSLANCR